MPAAVRAHIPDIPRLRARSTWESYKNFWLCLDSGHYVDIARDWYLSEGIRDRLVQLVFLPGYPIAIRLVNFLIGDYVVSGLLVSWLSFAGACSVIYSLLRLDYSHEVSLRTVRYLCIIPGVFFFISPMSESLFLLLSAGCVYLAGAGKPASAACSVHTPPSRVPWG